jgi:hypothetical protein
MLKLKLQRSHYSSFRLSKAPILSQLCHFGWRQKMTLLQMTTWKQNHFMDWDSTELSKISWYKLEILRYRFGDAGYKFKDEITDLRFDGAGVLAMANNGPATNSSHFITHVATHG